VSARIEEGVGVVYEAEQDGDGLFRAVEAWGKVVLGHPALLRSGNSVRMAPFLHRQTAQYSSRPPTWASAPRRTPAEPLLSATAHFAAGAEPHPGPGLAVGYAVSIVTSASPSVPSRARNAKSGSIIYTDFVAKCG
jgi:hypothetical protein